jgi:hypothetical protein
VVAKVNRSANDISDATHYLEGETMMAKGGTIKEGDKFGDYSITNYSPIKYDDLGGSNNGLVKLVNQEDFDTILIQYDNSLRGGKWFVSKNGILYEGKNPNEVIDKLNLNKMAKGGTIKGLNTKTNERFEVISGSEIKSDKYIENGMELNVRKVYGSRISEVKLIFDENGNLFLVIDYGYSFNKPPNLSMGNGTKYQADKKNTLQILSKMYTPSFAKNIIQSVSPKMAKGGVVKYYDKDNSYRLGRPSGSIEKDILERITFKKSVTEEDFVGNFGWKTPQCKLGDGYLFRLGEYDQNLIKDLKLKSGEKIFRYFNRLSAIGGMTPLIKMNLDKGLIYFLQDSDNDEIVFETRGTNALWIGLIEDKMAKGGKVAPKMNELNYSTKGWGHKNKK